MRYVEGGDLGDLIAREAPSSPPGRWSSCRKLRRPSTPHTPESWFIATSSPETSCSRTATPISPTSGSRSRSRSPGEWSRAITSRRRHTSRPSRSRAGPLGLRLTSTRSPACCTSACAACRRSTTTRSRVCSSRTLGAGLQLPSSRNGALGSSIDAVLGRALAKHPTERQGSCAELIADAERALGLHTTGKRPLWIGLAAATALAAAVIGGALLTGRGGDARAPLPSSTRSCS